MSLHCRTTAAVPPNAAGSSLVPAGGRHPLREGHTIRTTANLYQFVLSVNNVLLDNFGQMAAGGVGVAEFARIQTSP